MDLSVIIVTYNGRELALATLDSFQRALAAVAHYGCEVIVVDNASRDGVAAAVAAHPIGARVLRNEENVGFSRASNRGFAASCGRFLLFANPDVEVDARTLPVLIEYLTAYPAVAAGTPRLWLVGRPGIDWGSHRGFPTRWAAATHFAGLARLTRHSPRLARVFGRYQLFDRDLDEPHEVDVIEGGFFFVRREAFVAAGRWDEDYFLFGEDIDLCYRLKRNGGRIVYLPQAQAWHHLGGTTGLKKGCRSAVGHHGDRRRAYDSFYDAMHIFYDKHYRDRYSAPVRGLVRLGIETRRRLGRARLHV